MRESLKKKSKKKETRGVTLEREIRLRSDGQLGAIKFGRRDSLCVAISAMNREREESKSITA